MLSPALANILKSVEQVSEEQQDQVAEYLRGLIGQMNELEPLLQYGNEQIREIAFQRGINWDELNEHQREDLIGNILHED